MLIKQLLYIITLIIQVVTTESIIMEANLIVEALKFMMLGMGVVFTFLTIMIFVLKAQGALIGKYFPEKGKEPAKMPQNSSASNQSAKIAAIVAAVQHHKNLKG